MFESSSNLTITSITYWSYINMESLITWSSKRTVNMTRPMILNNNTFFPMPRKGIFSKIGAGPLPR